MAEIRKHDEITTKTVVVQLQSANGPLLLAECGTIVFHPDRLFLALLGAGYRWLIL